MLIFLRKIGFFRVIQWEELRIKSLVINKINKTNKEKIRLQ